MRTVKFFFSLFWVVVILVDVVDILPVNVCDHCKHYEFKYAQMHTLTHILIMCSMFMHSREIGEARVGSTT